MQDLELKQAVLSCDLNKDYNRFKRLFNLYMADKISESEVIELERLTKTKGALFLPDERNNEIFCDFDGVVYKSSDVVRVCYNLNINHWKRTNRLKNRISKMVSGSPCLFLTLTFKDSVLNSTSQDTRRRYVTRFLKSFGVEYIANIDFGKNNGREHYHAILQADKIDYSLWNYGAINGRRINACYSSNVKLAKYISKLTNHALKKTTKQNRIIYSKSQ